VAGEKRNERPTNGILKDAVRRTSATVVTSLRMHVVADRFPQFFCHM
jgi:hypothetical protein